MKYRQKPRLVDAIAVKDVIDAYAEGLKSKAWRGLPKWFHESWDAGKIMFASPSTQTTLFVQEKEMGRWAEGTDMIVFGQTFKGELTRMRHSVFRTLYERVVRDAG